MKKDLVRIIISIVLFILGFVFLNIHELTSIILFVSAYIISGYDILFKAIVNILHGKFLDEFFLMSLATIGAFVLKSFEEAAGVMIFFQIGELFQTYSVNKSRKSIVSLMDLKPDVANLIINNEIMVVDPFDVELGSIILVNPGEKVPLDGIVIEGSSSINTSSLTGESMPLEVKEESKVLSGSINLLKPLKIKTTEIFENSTVMKILDLVENATMSKAKSENFITKFARFYTPIVVISALLLAFIPPLILGFNENFTIWLYRALTFLVVSCPCALVISVPLSFFAGIGACAKNKILVKGSNYLDALSNTKTVVFDKTGTITKGNFKVNNIKEVNGSKEDILYYAACAEAMSNHPIAIAIKNEVNSKIINETFEELTGYGIKAIVDQKEIYCGNKKMLDNLGIDITEDNIYDSVVYVVKDKIYLGAIYISDEIKNGAKETISYLNNYNINTVLLTGDNYNVASKIAKEVGISNFHASLLPNDKVDKFKNIVKEKKNEKDVIVFVGDGINDAPVLALADVGISMGSLGSDAAIEASDIVLMNDDITKINTAINISKKTKIIVLENIIFAISIKILVLVLAALGYAYMWLAIFADVGVSVIAIINAMRALIYKEK